MEHTDLGRIGLQVSRLCLGTVNFGRHASEEDSFSILSQALQTGINFFDSDITAPIIGPRTVKQLEDNLSVLKLELDDEVLAKLNEIWTGPGGEAAEAYAW